MTRRVLIAASRGWANTGLIRSTLATVWDPDTVLVSGNARGGDKLCEACWEAWGGTVERHRADWSQGRAAGFRRNAKMVATKPDECIAFILNGSAGASDTAARAEAAGIPTRRVEEFTEPNHRCPGGCGQQVPDRFLACPPCWRRLPGDLKRPVLGNRIGSDQHGAAVADAFRWYAENTHTRRP